MAKACLDWVHVQAQKPLTEVDPEKLAPEILHYLNLAEGQLDTLSKTHPGSQYVQSLLGIVHLMYGRPAEALRCYKKALAKDPRNPDVLYNMGHALMELERYEEALTQFSRLTAQYPQHGLGWHMLGEASRLSGRPEEALLAYEKARKLLRGMFQVYGGIGSALRKLDRDEEALAAYEQGLSIQPDHIDLNLRVAGAALSTGHWMKGWRHYVCRSGSDRHLPVPEDYVFPIQPGQPLRVYVDQGLGDELFFLRFAPVLVSRGMTIHYTAHPKLYPLLLGQPSLSVLNKAFDRKTTQYDILVGDLPLLAGMNATSDIPPSLELHPDDVKVERYRESLQAFGPPPYLGITWQGGKIKEQGHKGLWRELFKEIQPAMLGQLAHDWPGTVVVLQRLPSPESLASFGKALGRPFLDWSYVNDDLTDALAGLSLLDEYVGVSNTNMHLMAGVGKTARVLVPHPADWRWMAHGKESPWFPGFKIYRQDGKTQSWDAALKELSADLKARWG